MFKADKISYEHEIFSHYIDPLALGPGVDHPLAIGTEMRYFSMYDPLTSSSKKFKRVLEDDR